MRETFITTSAEETKNVGRNLAGEILSETLLCLRGDLGAGKTTFTQGLLEGLGATHPYISPTFVIMKQYDLPMSQNGIERVYHVDAYRVTVKDFQELGFLEWCEDKKGIVILEWPERIAEILPEKKTEIILKTLSESKREIIVQ